VSGVEIQTLWSRDVGRGSESRYKKRYKVTRELVEAFDTVWMIEYRKEKGGSANGSYSRIQNATATKLEVN
jgi:hypothetical protein